MYFTWTPLYVYGNISSELFLNNTFSTQFSEQLQTNNLRSAPFFATG
jgi:hypothetical protein